MAWWLAFSEDRAVVKRRTASLLPLYTGTYRPMLTITIHYQQPRWGCFEYGPYVLLLRAPGWKTPNHNILWSASAEKCVKAFSLQRPMDASLAGLPRSGASVPRTQRCVPVKNPQNISEQPLDFFNAAR